MLSEYEKSRVKYMQNAGMHSTPGMANYILTPKEIFQKAMASRNITPRQPLPMLPMPQVGMIHRLIANLRKPGRGG
jgi:hypothetical protein